MNHTLVPTYYKEFSCIGSLCEDTCCAGWSIPVDKKTFKKYKKLPKNSDINKGIEKNSMSKEDSNYGYIKMGNNGCSFLTKEKLCGIQIDLGEDYLCNTCSMYPRRFNSVNNVIEKSISISCPEAARKVLLVPEGISFENGIDKINPKLISSVIKTNSNTIHSWKDLFEEYRYSMIYILQNRNYSIEDRLILIGMFIKEIQKEITNKSLDDIPNFIGSFLNVVDDLEIKKDLSEVGKREDLQLKLFRELSILRLADNVSSERYLECSRETQEGLFLNSNISEKEIIENYNKKYKEVYEPFMDKHSYILENYLVNYVFKNCFPVDNDDPYESYIKLLMHFLLIKNHLIGIGAYHNSLTVDMSIKVIQSMSKTFEHNIFYFKEVIKKIENMGISDFNYITLLIKN